MKLGSAPMRLSRLGNQITRIKRLVREWEERWELILDPIAWSVLTVITAIACISLVIGL